MAGIKYEIEAEGAPRAERSLKSILRGLQDLKKSQGSLTEETSRLRDSQAQLSMSTERASRSQEAAQRSTQALTQSNSRLATKLRDNNAAMAVMTQALVSLSQQAGETTSSTGQLATGLTSVASGAASGAAAFGPWGALIGGLVAALPQLTRALDESGQASERATRRHQEHSSALSDLLTVMREERATNRLREGLGSVEDQTRALTDAQDQAQAASILVTRAEVQLAEARRNHMHSLFGERDAILAAEQNLRQMEANYDRARDAVTRYGNALSNVRAEQQLAAEEAAETAAFVAAWSHQMAEGEARANQRRAAAGRNRQEQLRREQETRRWIAQWEAQLTDQQVQQEQEAEEAKQAARVVSLEAYKTRLAEEERLAEENRAFMLRLEAQYQEERWQLEEEARQRRANAEKETAAFIGNELSKATQTVANATVNLIKQAAAGEKAFDAVLSAFLEMIAQMALVESLKNLAQGVQAAATQNWDAFALHMAAVGIWGGVAALAGGAAAATAPAEAQAASPQEDRDAGGGQGEAGPTIVNFNGGFVTAATYTEVGEQIVDIIEETEFRRGRRRAA